MIGLRLANQYLIGHLSRLMSIDGFRNHIVWWGGQPVNHSEVDMILGAYLGSATGFHAQIIEMIQKW